MAGRERKSSSRVGSGTNIPMPGVRFIASCIVASVGAACRRPLCTPAESIRRCNRTCTRGWVASAASPRPNISTVFGMRSGLHGTGWALAGRPSASASSRVVRTSVPVTPSTQAW